MIEFVKAFKTSDGATHASIELAKRHELVALFRNPAETEGKDIQAEHTADDVIANADRIVDILTMTASSKPKARKVNGGTKKRTPKTPTTEPATGAG